MIVKILTLLCVFTTTNGLPIDSKIDIGLSSEGSRGLSMHEVEDHVDTEHSKDRFLEDFPTALQAGKQDHGGLNHGAPEPPDKGLIGLEVEDKLISGKLLAGFLDDNKTQSDFTIIHSEEENKSTNIKNDEPAEVEISLWRKPSMTNKGSCASHPCQNGGRCSEAEDPYGWGFYCYCIGVGAGGKLCQIENPCVTNPCPVGAAHCLVGNDDKYGRYCYTATWAQMFDRGDDA